MNNVIQMFINRHENENGEKIASLIIENACVLIRKKERKGWLVYLFWRLLFVVFFNIEPKTRMDTEKE